MAEDEKTQGANLDATETTEASTVMTQETAPLSGLTAPDGSAPVNPPQPRHAEKDRLFVSKVPQLLGQAELRAYFAQFGELTDVYLPSAPGGGGHKGICFVSFNNGSGIQRAMAHGPHEVQGCPTSVDIAAPRAPPPTTVSQSVQTGCRVFLTKVTSEVTRADLQAYFCRFGELSDCYVPPGNKGIAFVSYKDPSNASSVVANQQHEVKPGQTVIAAPAFDRPTPNKGGGKGAAAMGCGGCGCACGSFGAPCGCGCCDACGCGGCGCCGGCCGCGGCDMGCGQFGVGGSSCSGFIGGCMPGMGMPGMGVQMGPMAPMGGMAPMAPMGMQPSFQNFAMDGCGGQFQQPQQGCGCGCNFGMDMSGQQMLGQAAYGAMQPQMAQMQRPAPY